MINFSPKERFQKNKENREAWGRLVTEPLLHTVLNDALAEMAFRRSCLSPEQLLGVNNFIAILLNISEAPTPSSTPPMKELTSWDNPATTSATK